MDDTGDKAKDTEKSEGALKAANARKTEESKNPVRELER